MIGAVFAFTAQHDVAMRLFSFVAAHGFVELSVICVAGAAGASLGEALVRPGDLTRREAFQVASARIGKLLVPCTLLLVGCGFIEGYVSPDPTFPLASRLVDRHRLLGADGRAAQRAPGARSDAAVAPQSRVVGEHGGLEIRGAGSNHRRAGAAQ